MQLASYKGTRPGWQGLFNRIIRWRFDGPYSHTEVVFEPGDAVDYLMPDGTTLPNADGALWCASSVAAERLPEGDGYRAGKVGGLRFKRIVLDRTKWDLQPVWCDYSFAARYMKEKAGTPYSWRLIAKLAAWFISLRGTKQLTCSQACAVAIGIAEADAWRFDPCTLYAAVKARL